MIGMINSKKKWFGDILLKVIIFLLFTGYAIFFPICISPPASLVPPFSLLKLTGEHDKERELLNYFPHGTFPIFLVSDFSFGTRLMRLRAPYPADLPILSGTLLTVFIKKFIGESEGTNDLSSLRNKLSQNTNLFLVTFQRDLTLLKSWQIISILVPLHVPIRKFIRKRILFLVCWD